MGNGFPGIQPFWWPVNAVHKLRIAYSSCMILSSYITHLFQLGYTFYVVSLKNVFPINYPQVNSSSIYEWLHFYVVTFIYLEVCLCVYVHAQTLDKGL